MQSSFVDACSAVNLDCLFGVEYVATCTHCAVKCLVGGTVDNRASMVEQDQRLVLPSYFVLTYGINNLVLWIDKTVL